MAIRPKRPRSVTALVALVLTFTGMQLLRAWVAMRKLTFLSTLPLSVSPLFFVISGLLWGTLGLWLSNGLWRGKRAARKATMVSAALFAGFAWVDRLALEASGPQTVSRPFELVLTAMLLGVVYAVLTVPEAQRYFQE